MAAIPSGDAGVGFWPELLRRFASLGGDAGDLRAAWREVTEALALALRVERAGLWLLRADHSALSCIDHYTQGAHERGLDLDPHEFAGMLRALEHEPAIAAHDACFDPRLVAIASHFERLGIVSVLVAPVRVGGAIVGVVTAEHQGSDRVWEPGEVELARSLGDLVGLAMEVQERRRTAELLARTEARYGLLASSISDVVWTFDASLRVGYVSPSVERQRGLAVHEAAALSPEEALSEDAGALCRAALAPDGEPDAELLTRLRAGMRLETELERKDGSRFWAEVCLTWHEGTEGGPATLVATSRDAQSMRRESLRAAESEATQALLARLASDGIWEWDHGRDQVTYSPRFKQLLGIPDDTPMSTREAWFEGVHAEDRERLASKLERLGRGETASMDEEIRMNHRDGTTRWVQVRALPGQGARTGKVVGVISDVTARKRFEEQLRHDAFHDTLTSLPNRALFKDHLDRITRRRVRNPDLMFAVLLLDLDEFKVVNDGLGHLQGDELLVQIARRLEYGLRPADTVARFGGDEFAILLDEIAEVGDATRVAERLLSDLTRPFVVGGEEVYLSASVGIAASGPGYERPDDLLRDADTAMYRAKLKGRGQYEVFDPKMHRRALERIQLETDLRRALERGEFRIYYQPIVCLSDDEVVGFETLIRWEHPERGLLTPYHFLEAAEDAGLIVPVGWRMLEEACRQAREWRDMFPHRSAPLFVSVNLSNRQFAQPDLVEQVERTLITTDLPATCLRLEITEGVVAENAEAAKEVLLKLRAMGVHLDIDDFGTGYSSLSQLHYFPVDTLKIDRSFVARMGARGEQSDVVRTIIALAGHLGMSVTAEGIETADQLRTLKTLACHHGQGYYFSKPTTAEGATKLLIRDPPGWSACDVA